MANADARYCGSSKFIQQIEVQPWGDRNFKIEVYPTAETRWNSAMALTPRDAVVDEWHAIQRCVPGLHGDPADSIWQQLECHQYLAFLYNPTTGTWATGPTYDLESWRPKLGYPSLGNEEYHHRLNALGVDPAGPYSGISTSGLRGTRAWVAGSLRR